MVVVEAVYAEDGDGLRSGEMCAKQVEIVRDYIADGKSFRGLNSASSGLFRAAIEGDVEVLRAELRYGSNADVVPEALYLAVMAGQTSSVRAFLDAGWKINREVDRGSTVLHIAIGCDRPEIAELALNLGVNPAVGPVDGRDNLVEAILAESVGSVELLLRWGVDPQASDRPDGRSILDFARQWAEQRQTTASRRIVTILEGARDTAP